ncbi:hypothetical protein KIPB_005543 [Kipferlia bialata]|uniref:MYND-type domain-containing protein n=1 Tax=Kipferlia bialata TaxID=797122 RepID=A0A9K3GIA6_9EUKA|nr:hypothetical protein KIPB_005543 [Kipferlia bialata]|eukprot:g5543.t1
MQKGRQQKEGAMQSIPLNALATPKGHRYLCDICGGISTVMCPLCRSSYCCQEHYELDVLAVHPSICDTLAELRKISASPPHSEKDRETQDAYRRNLRESIMTVAERAALEHLDGGKERASTAMVAALRCLRFAAVSFPDEPLASVRPLFLLSEAALQANDFTSVHKYVLSARRLLQVERERVGDFLVGIVHDIPRTRDLAELWADLHLLLGRAAHVQGKASLDSINKDFSLAAYYSSLSQGVESLQYGHCLYWTGMLYADMGDTETARRYFGQVVSVWAKNCWFLIDNPSMQSDPLLYHDNVVPTLVQWYGEHLPSHMDHQRIRFVSSCVFAILGRFDEAIQVIGQVGVALADREAALQAAGPGSAMSDTDPEELRVLTARMDMLREMINNAN